MLNIPLNGMTAYDFDILVTYLLSPADQPFKTSSSQAKDAIKGSVIPGLLCETGWLRRALMDSGIGVG